MKNLLLLISLLVGAITTTHSQVTFVREDSLSDNSRRIIEESQNNIFDDPRTPRFIITDKSQKFLFGIGGFVCAQGYYDFTGLNESGECADLLSIPFDSQEPDKMNLSAATSLLSFKLLADTEIGVVEANFETDFDSNNSALRLRKAYIRLGGFLVGQDWSTMTDTYSFPSVIDGADPVGKVGYRLPLIRYNFNIGERWEIFSSLEFPELTYAYNDESYVLSEKRPDFNNKVVYKSTSGKYIGQAAAILRYLKVGVSQDLEMVPNSGFCWGMSLANQINIGKSSIYLAGSMGLGVSDHFAGVSSHQMNVVEHTDIQNGNVDFVPLWVYNLVGGYTFNWSENSSSSLVASYLKVSDRNIDNRANVSQSTIDHLYSLSVNYITEIIPHLTVGGEVFFAHKTVFDGGHAHGLRAVAMIRYDF